MSEDQEELVEKIQNDSTTGAPGMDPAKKKKIKWIIIGLLILIVVVLAIVLPLTLIKKDNPPVPNIPTGYNQYNLDPQQVSFTQYSFTGILDGKQNAEQLSRVAQSLNQKLQDTLNFEVDSRNIVSGLNNQNIDQVSFTFEMINPSIARLIMTDANNPDRYTPPDTVLPRPKADIHQLLEMVGFSYIQNPFSFSFKDPANPSNVFITTEGQTLLLMDKYIQIDFVLPSQRLYGFGERVREFNLAPGTWTMWAQEPKASYDDGTGRNTAYGVHPFILVQSQNKGEYFGIYFRNSNAMSPVLRTQDNGKMLLSYITIGGQIEAYFILHGSVKQIIQKYHSLIGNPTLPPLWSLGWQQSSFKFQTQQQLSDMVKAYSDAKINLEAIYIDIYANTHVDFNVDPIAYPSLAAFTAQLHGNNQKIIPVVDPYISAVNTSNPYYWAGNSVNAFIKSSIYNSTQYNGNLLSKSYADKAVFIDWLNDQCMDVWGNGLQSLYQIFPYDGIWLDLNEPSALVDGELRPDDIPAPTDLQQTQRRELLGDGNTQWYSHVGDMSTQSTFNLPFVPQYQKYGNFDVKTLSLNATHPGFNNEIEYNLHNLYGHMQSWRTQQFLTSAQSNVSYDNRPFILSRNTFASTGRFASAWFGENDRTWDSLRLSISGIMNMNMFGIPQSGVPVCGYAGNSTANNDELCARWIQLATFYPLARVHSSGSTTDPATEPYNLKDPYKAMAQKSIADRYQYMRLMYTCLYEVSQNGGTCFDPLFYHFPNDDNLYQNYEESFIVASALKVSPVTSDLGITGQFTSYFPSATFVDMNNYTNVINATTQPGQMSLSLGQQTVQVHLKSGSLIPFQDNSDMKVNTTQDLLTKPIILIANRDSNGQAQGSLLLDKGISRSEIYSGKHGYFKFSLQAKSMQVFYKSGDQNIQSAMTFDRLRLVNAMDIIDTDFACYLDHNLNPTTLNVAKGQDLKMVELIAQTPTQFSNIKIIYYGKGGKDINYCKPDAFNYKVKLGEIINLDQNSTSFIVQSSSQSPPLLDLRVSLMMTNDNTVRIKWTYDKQPENYKTPFTVPNEIIQDTGVGSNVKLSTKVMIQNDPFQITVLSTPRSQGFTVTGMMLDQYINVIKSTVYTESDNNFKGIFGLGERANPDFFYKDGVYSMWAKDIPTPIENGREPGNNLYGTHPFYMYKFAQGNWMGVFTNLANAQDWYIKNDPGNGEVDLQTYSTGGIADIYVMTGSTPEDVVKNYFKIVGKPVLIPQWVLGWNQCRYGYNNTDQLASVLQGYTSNNIPLDVMWSDIDYLFSYQDFTYDKASDRYLKLPDFIQTLKGQNMHYVPIIDAGVSMRPNSGYAAYDQGKKDDVFMKIRNGEDLIAQVWPKDSVFPDWFNPKTSPWWQNQLTSMQKNLSFDGLWLDMNEASDFCGGLCYQNQQVDSPIKYKLPYVPTGRDLEEQSMPLDTFSVNGVTQLDSHNLFGVQEIASTDSWFNQQDMRTFILSRSSYAGLGKFSSKWLGDNFSQDIYMKLSVSGIMLMNMFGIPVMGADICGFIGNTNPELCARWHVVGSFYPFSRNHNAIDAIDQEPVVFKNMIYEDAITYMDIMKMAIVNKYCLVRYYYQSLMRMSINGDSTFYKPLFFEYPDDSNAYQNITNNIMIGPSLKLGVNSEHVGQNKTTFYFPQGVWCNIFDPYRDPCFNSTGIAQERSSKAYEFYLHLREGHIVPMQDARTLKAKNTFDLTKAPVDFHILGTPSFNQGVPNFRAYGHYYNDDGLNRTLVNNSNAYDIQVYSNNQDPSNYVIIQISMTSIAMNYMVQDSYQTCYAVNQNDYLGNLYFYNAKQYQLQGTYQAFAYINGHPTMFDLGQATYDPDSDRLILQNQSPTCLSAVLMVKFIKTS